MLQRSPRFRFDEFSQPKESGAGITLNGKPIGDMRHRKSRTAAGGEIWYEFDKFDLSRIEPGDGATLTIDGVKFHIVKQDSEIGAPAEDNWSILRDGQSLGEKAFRLMLMEGVFRSNSTVITSGRTAILHNNPDDEASLRKFRRLGPERRLGPDSMPPSGIPSAISVLALSQEIELRKAV